MIKFFIDAISKGLAFSKAEAKGTFLLIIIVILSITSFRLVSNKVKNTGEIEYDPSELSAWVKEVEASYSKRKEEEKLAEQSNPDSFQKEWKPIEYKKKYKKTKPQPKAEEIPPPIVDLNMATAEELQQIRGIGKVYSQRIVKYRDMLGGFVSMQQLEEVYGLNTELVNKISERFALQSGAKKIDINADSVKFLAKHPYISYDLAWVIINYRKQNGDIKSFEDLKGIKALNDSILIKLKPYLE